jgi:flagellar biosynthesis/type III secretory pathway M-ring protein FliF/YscJ
MPTPSLREGISEDQVTPGLLGFIMTAFFVLATALLIVDMVRRIRRVRYRGQVEEERQAAAEAADIEAADLEAGEVRQPVDHRRQPAEDRSETPE